MRKTVLAPLTLAFLTACGGANSVLYGAAASSAPLAARTHDLLYVSDWGAGDVSFYSYPQLKRLGTLQGLTPGGPCADAAGDVFVPNVERKQVLEYAHGGSAPIAILDNDGHRPRACAVDARNGDLAVVNLEKSAGISIFRHASGSPRTVTAKGIYAYAFCAYDGAGNLYVDGQMKDNTFELAELTSRSRSFVRIAVDRKIHWGGGVAWDGAYLAISDQGLHGMQTHLYRFAIAGHSGKTVSAALLGDSLDVPQFSIDAAALVGPDTGRESGNVLRIWPYPNGGAPIRTLQGFIEPIGAAISRGTP